MSRARYSPSTLPHLAKCPGFVGGLPSTAAQRGTDLDACITALISGDFVDVPAEFQDQVDFALEAYREILDVVRDPKVETQKFLRSAIPEVYGTADLVVIGHPRFNPEGGVIHDRYHAIISDLKSGMTDRGPAQDHLQIQAYGAALLYENPDILTIELRLIELDKRFVSRSQIFMREEFLAEVHTRIIGIIEKVKSATEKDYVQNSSCRYCVRAVTCPAVEKALQEIAPDPLAVADPQQFVDMMAPDRLAWFLNKWRAKVDVMSGLIKTAEGRAFAIIKAGGDVPGWAIGEGRKMRSWENPQVAEETLRAVYGDKVLKTELKSPAQVEKEFKEAKSLVKRLVQTKPSEKLIQVEGETNV